MCCGGDCFCGVREAAILQYDKITPERAPGKKRGLATNGDPPLRNSGESMRKGRNPGTKKQWRDYLTRIINIATAFYWLVSLLLKLIELTERLMV